MWPDRRILDLLGIELPIIQSPMAGAQDSDLAVAVAEAGGLGSLPCAMLTPAQVRAEVDSIRRRTARPINLNFFCHTPPHPDPDRELAWRRRLAPYYSEFGLDPERPIAPSNRAPFDSAMCDVVEQCRPQIVSFHFGLPEPGLLRRVQSTGARILSSATTVDEARWLADRGCDAIIAQGTEAGGHRGMFLTEDVTTQLGTIALVPQVVDAVSVPVIAAGGIADGRGIRAAFALGASAVQIGTAYLRCPEARISDVHRRALFGPEARRTAITNVFTGRPARGIVNRVIEELGPLTGIAPQFPLAAAALAPLRKSSEAALSEDFAQMWASQSAPLARELPAGELTRMLASEARR
ncbi:MAG: 2-nitropropane dioxygenase [Candidatus Solibacter sp.]|nr:2-nitropropane dioxygenase [Candidatus Solibacter sp.]